MKAAKKQVPFDSLRSLRASSPLHSASLRSGRDDKVWMRALVTARISRRAGRGSLLTQFIEFGQNFVAVLRGIYAVVDLCDLSIWIDDKGVTGGEFRYAQVGERSVDLGNFVVRVSQQFEIEPFFGAETLVGVDVVHANAQHYRVVLGILGGVGLEVMGLAGAARGLIFGVEVEHGPLAALIPPARARSETVLYENPSLRNV